MNSLYAGVRFNSYHGNFMLRSTDLIALPAVDCDKAFAMQLSLEDTLLTTQTVYFQVALLYPLILDSCCFIVKFSQKVWVCRRGAHVGKFFLFNLLSSCL